MNPTITVDNLSKFYRINSGAKSQYKTLRESICEWAGVALGRLAPLRTPSERIPDSADRHDLWALRDISFNVRPGEVLGVVGRNGAGKSTLLKILSRIASPTAGSVRLRGRVGSLLEVGTGFHPELTGRENIYLNGAILGMTRREISRKFDEVVAFAEVDRFLDTPVKRYSSGMYTRLAFAVASHLDPDILVVDEVLAVGDAEFQAKCLGRMGQVSRGGRTVLFVSHNMSAIKSLCSRAILIEKGRLVMDGDVDSVVARYLTGSTDMSQTGIIPDDAPRYQDRHDEARFRSVGMTTLDGTKTTQLYFRQPFRVSFECEVLRDIPDGHFEISISTVDGVHVTYSTTIDGGLKGCRLAKGMHRLSAEFDCPLLPRQYTIDLGVHHHNGTTADFVQRTLDFTVMKVALNATDHYPWPRTRGYIRVPARWQASNGESAIPAGSIA